MASLFRWPFAFDAQMFASTDVIIGFLVLRSGVRVVCFRMWLTHLVFVFVYVSYFDDIDDDDDQNALSSRNSKPSI
jgi:hypothetical protein